MHREDRLDESGHPRRRERVSQDRLHGAEMGRGVPPRPQLPQGVPLDGITDLRPGPVRLQVAHGVRGQARVTVGPSQGAQLTGRLRTHASRDGSVVGGSHAPDHGVHPVAGRLCVGQWAQDQEAGPLAEDEPVGLRAERQAPSGAREGPDPAQPHEQVGGEDQLRATGQGDTATPRAQRVHGVGHGGETSGAGRVEREALTVQAEDRTDGVRAHVEEEPGHGRTVQVVHRPDGLRPSGARGPRPELATGQLAHPYPHGAELAVSGLGERGDHRRLLPVEPAGLPSRVLDRLARQIDEQPMLRVQRPGPARRHSVVLRVETAHVRQERHRVRIGGGRVAGVLAEQGGPAPPRVGHRAELRPRGHQEPPVLIHVQRSREPAGHPHDRDVVAHRSRRTHRAIPSLVTPERTQH